MGEKTKKPTAKKKRDSIKKGDVANVPTIGKLLSLIGVVELALAMRETWLRILEGHVGFALSMVHAADGSPGSHALFSLVAAPLLVAAVAMCLSAMAVAALLALIGNLLQHGLVFSPEAVPKMELLSPISNVKQMLSPEQLLQLPLNIIKVIIIGASVSFSIAMSLNNLLHIADGSLEFMFNAALDLIGYTERSALVFIFFCVVLDWMLRRHFHQKQLLMSKEEVEQEQKDQYGDKHTKGQRKKMSQDLLLGALSESTRKSDAVVTNPTHFAVALLYDPEKCPLPVVMARGSGASALQMIAIAKRHGIPVVRSIWLARTLYAIGREGRVIPRLTLRAVAAVYRAILEIMAQGHFIDDVIELDQGNGEQASPVAPEQQ